MLAVVLSGCGGEPNPGVSSKMDLDGGFFDAPFPSAHRDRGDGTLVVADFPTGGNALLEQLVVMLETGVTGFSPNGAIYFQFDGPVDASRLPATPADSLEPDSTVFLVDVDIDSDRYGQRIPIEASFKAAAETHTPANTLVVLPFQGAVLTPNTTYAAIVMRTLGDTQGRALFFPPLLEALLFDDAIPGPEGERLNAAFAELNAWRVQGQTPLHTEIAAATVFTTGDATSQMHDLYQQVGATPPAPMAELRGTETYDDFCVVAARITLPNFQGGDKPYADFPAGQLVLGTDGQLQEQGRDELEIVMSIPRAPMPAEGFPIVLYAAGAEGKARQVIDRTAIDSDPDAGRGPRGQGPALHYARRGVATFGFPAPLTWDRHPEGAGGLLDFWNVANLGTFRDVLRQGALDFATVVPLIATVEIPARHCPGATSDSGRFHFDPDQIYLHGHSTGATIGGAVIALDRNIRGGVMSGAGGSWIYNVALAEAPFDLAGISHLLLDFDSTDTIDIFDPALTLFQHALESVEVMSWGRATVRHPLVGVPPKQLLHIEGVVDTYHFPRMANAYSMAVGLDLVQPEAEPTAAVELALVGRDVIPAPASANFGESGNLTAALIQRAQNHQDGHYVSFELDDVKYRYSCFIATAIADGVATVARPKDDPTAPCD